MHTAYDLFSSAGSNRSTRDKQASSVFLLRLNSICFTDRKPAEIKKVDNRLCVRLSKNVTDSYRFQF